MQLLQGRLKDRKILNLIWKFLRAGMMEGELFYQTDQGVPQGGIVSPLLANTYGRLFGRKGTVALMLS